MSELRTTGSRAPWLAAGVLGVVCAVLAVWLAVWIMPNRHASAGLTKSELDAVTAAKQYVINQLTITRAHFDQDYDRVLAQTTGKLHDDAQAKKAPLKAQLDSGKFDTAGQVTAAAFVGRAGNNSDVLVSATASKVTSSGSVPTSTYRFKMTMTWSGHRWLASNLEFVALA